MSNQPIRVTHVSYSSSGGAGTVARRLKNYQSGHLAIDSNFIFITQESLRQDPLADPFVFLAALKDELLVKKVGSGPMISLYRNRTRRQIVSQLYNEEGIVHFHWINGVIQIFDLPYHLIQKKKLVWTMHDMEPFTGGCHHALSCDQFKSLCINCPLVRKKYKKNIMSQHNKKINYLEKIKNVKFVVPSRWLKLSAQKSSLLRDQELAVIYNPVEDIFFENDTVYEIENKKENDITVGFVSTNLESPLKNYNSLKAIIKKLNEISTTKFKVLAVGKSGSNFSGHNIVEVGLVEDSFLMAHHYKSMDVLVVASITESFGLSVAEAAASQVPTIVLAGTATQELVIHEKTGFIAQSNEEIFDYLKAYSENPLIMLLHGKQAKVHAKKNFSEKVVNDKYLELYSNLL